MIFAVGDNVDFTKSGRYPKELRGIVSHLDPSTGWADVDTPDGKTNRVLIRRMRKVDLDHKPQALKGDL